VNRPRPGANTRPSRAPARRPEMEPPSGKGEEKRNDARAETDLSSHDR
jgi:hypothetical protein